MRMPGSICGPERLRFLRALDLGPELHELVGFGLDVGGVALVGGAPIRGAQEGRERSLTPLPMRWDWVGRTLSSR